MGDESFYELALLEYDTGEADKGLMAKAYVAADGVESRVKIEYMKLRVTQLKGGSSGSLRSWYSATSINERAIYVVLSIILIAAFGIGLIPLAVLIWLAAGERDELARRAKQNATSASS